MSCRMIKTRLKLNLCCCGDVSHLIGQTSPWTTLCSQIDSVTLHERSVRGFCLRLPQVIVEVGEGGDFGSFIGKGRPYVILCVNRPSNFVRRHDLRDWSKGCVGDMGGTQEGVQVVPPSRHI